MNEKSAVMAMAGAESGMTMVQKMRDWLAPSMMANPRRAVVGWDSGRLAMLLAVLETRCGIRLHDKEVYLNVAGGLKIQEPAADMAIAAALLSALSEKPTPTGAVYFGELALSGEIRRVARADARLKEAEKLGFTKAFTPSAVKKEKGLGISGLNHIQELAKLFLSDE